MSKRNIAVIPAQNRTNAAADPIDATVPYGKSEARAEGGDLPAVTSLFCENSPPPG